MLKDLEGHYGQKVFSGKAYDVMLSLDLDKYVAWRRVVLPEHLTFLQLHEVIQCAFSWGNYHLFRFELKDRNGQPIIIEHFFDEIDALHREDGTLMLFALTERMTDLRKMSVEFMALFNIIMRLIIQRIPVTMK